MLLQFSIHLPSSHSWGALGHFYWVSSKVAELENALDSLKHRSGKLLESYKLPKWNLFIGFNKSAAKTEWNRKKGEVPKVNFFVYVWLNTDLCLDSSFNTMAFVQVCKTNRC